MTSAQYILRKVTLPNELRLVTNGNPLLLPLGAISGIDATTLVTSVVVSAVANMPAETAAMMIQESWDGGTTWDDLTGLDADTITGVGTFRVKYTSATNLSSPHVRLKITPTGIGTLYLTQVYCTTNNGQIIPRASLTSSTVNDFGPSLSAARTASLVGNSSGPADWGAGPTTGQTLRVYEANSVSGFAQNHTDLLTIQQLITDLKTQMKPEYSSAFVPVDGAGVVLTANTWVPLVASTSAKAIRISYFQDSGYAIELGFGVSGFEASKIVLAEAGEEDLLIPASTRLSLRCKTTNTLGTFWLSALV